MKVITNFQKTFLYGFFEKNRYKYKLLLQLSVFSACPKFSNNFYNDFFKKPFKNYY